MKVIARILGSLAVVALVLAAIGAIVLRLGGFQYDAVVTGSMTASGIPAGSLVISRPVAGTDISPGDAILAESPHGERVLHRADAAPVAEGGELKLMMRGTSNAGADAHYYLVTKGAMIYVAHLPLLGQILLWCTLPLPWIGIPLWAVAGSLIIFWCALPTIRRRPRGQGVSSLARESA